MHVLLIVGLARVQGRMPGSSRNGLIWKWDEVSHLAEAMRSYRVGALVIPHTALEMWNMVV